MGTKPTLKPQDVIRLLQGKGFKEVCQQGSHKQFRHPDGRLTTLPFHKGKDISPILLQKIAQDIGLTVAEFINDKSPRR